MKNNQRKRRSLVVVAIILMIGLVSGMGAMTYARYISSVNVPAQQATAAKWGIVVTANADNLFGANYTDTDSDQLATFVESNGVAVKGTAGTDIVAPGTTGSMTITVSGVTEVRAELTLAVAAGYTDISLGDYKPVKWTLNKKVGDSAAANVDGAVGVDFATLVTKLAAENTEIAAGTEINVVYTISWAWAFDVDIETNIKDTIIGFKAADVAYDKLATTYAPAVNTDPAKLYSEHVTSDEYTAISTALSFTLSVTAQQIQ